MATHGKHSFFSSNNLQSNDFFATQDSAFFYRYMKVSFLLLKLTLTKWNENEDQRNCNPLQIWHVACFFPPFLSTLLNSAGKLGTLRCKRCEDTKQVTVGRKSSVSVLFSKNVNDSSKHVRNNFKHGNLIGQSSDHVIQAAMPVRFLFTPSEQ